MTLSSKPLFRCNECNVNATPIYCTPNNQGGYNVDCTGIKMFDCLLTTEWCIFIYNSSYKGHALGPLPV